MKKKEVERIINSINIALEEKKNWESSLIVGQEGSIIFKTQYAKEQQCIENIDLSKELNTILDMSIKNTRPTFCLGQSGTNWMFNYLNNFDIIDNEDLECIFCENEALEEYAIYDLTRGNYDFLHGTIGICYSFLYYKKQINIPFFENIFNILNKNLKESNCKMFGTFDFKKYSESQNDVNIGLAHGIVSILKFCVQCYSQNVCSENAKILSYQIIYFLKKNRNINDEISIFPNEINKSESILNSRLAWCYGDLGIGYILYQAGITFNDQKVIDFALEVLHHSTHRRTVEETQVFDAGICHGSAGVAHIYNRMWHYTKDPIFKEATDYWIQKTLDFAVHEDGVAGYKKYNPSTKAYENDYGLLEGAAGIGLVLLSYITGDFSWDYCLMLND